MKYVFPFSAIVGQEELKEALLIAAVDPHVGGVLAFGDRGTGKSTAIRGLAALLPPLEVVEGCIYGCAPDSNGGCEHVSASGKRKPSKSTKSNKKVAGTTTRQMPVVDLPLGATEDRVVGALDLESALVRGEKRFEPGLLAKANRGFLYIDEVNLLDDHLVDVLLDVAASGENVVEREGLSVRHPAQFVLVGSGNPEEGELRPQLIDRFGLSVDVRTPSNIDDRVEVVRRRDAFERDPAGFFAVWKRKDAAVRRKLEKARDEFSRVEAPDDVMRQASALCLHLGADGLRGELTLLRAARALAALDGSARVETKHLRKICVAALRHRLRRDPLDESDAKTRVERAAAEVLSA